MRAIESLHLVYRDDYREERNLLLLEALASHQNFADLLADNQTLGTEINKYELRLHSQNGEDGILLHIFSKVGATNRCFVEIGCGDGVECNTANLSLNFGWRGLLIDGSEKNVRICNYYYGRTLKKESGNVRVAQSFITTENVNRVVRDMGVEGEIDLLSIDIDGNDFWVWKALSAVSPRVVVIEYNASLGYDRSLTVEYDPNFDRLSKHPSGLYCGASLAALTKLAEEKGYVLVGCESRGINSFFVREDVARGKLRKVSVREAYFPCLTRSLGSPSEQFEKIKDLPFVTV